jgi:16S rRNA (guanine527-N7)-methyltransferase
MEKTRLLMDVCPNISGDRVMLFEQYLGLLLKWNRSHNLTSLNDPMEIYDKHFADSIVPAQFIPYGCRLIDIGTGAGFPGLPIKILRDDLDVTLLETTQKKVSFCAYVITELGLKGVRVVRGRGEDKELMRRLGRFDVVISRAAFKLPVYLGIGAGYLKKGGRLIAMVGATWPDELDKALPALIDNGLKIIDIQRYSLPFSKSDRALIVFERK